MSPRYFFGPLSSMLLMLWVLVNAPAALALGECGLSCCIGGTTTSGITLANKLGLSVQYEYMDMETIRHGTDEISPDEVIDLFWEMDSSYVVPTRMTMEKLSFIAAKPINERWQILGIVPFVRNNMDMRRKMPMGMVMNMEMEQVSGLGDITIMGLFTAYTDAPVRATQRVNLGVGIKTPTGDNDVRMPNGNLVHAMMQPGSGSWDVVFLANYMRAWYPLVTQVNAFYHYTTAGDKGYEFGNQFGLDFVGRYQVADFVNLGLELNAIHAGKDQDHDGEYTRPETSMLDNTDNTGLTSVFVTPGVQYKIPNSGGNLELKYQRPVYQDVNGYQQVVDSRWIASVSWAW